MGTYSVTYLAHLAETEFPSVDDRIRVVRQIDREFRAGYQHVLAGEAKVIVDKSSDLVSVTYETTDISRALYDEMATCLAGAFSRYEADASLPFQSRELVRPYPEWSKVRDDLGLLHPTMLKQLRTAMCFIVLDEGRPHAATIVRLGSSEFTNNLQTTPMRLYLGLCRAASADLFFFYPVVADEKDLWWAETWIYPYDDERIGSALDDPLDKEARRRLGLLLNQEFSHVLIVDEHDRLRSATRIPFTRSQRQGFPELAGALKEYEGKKISLVQAKDAMNEYLAAVSKPQLVQQFELLLREE